jgi:hypothetical protein
MFVTPDCGDAATFGPGFTERGSLGLGVWVRTRFDLSSFLGRRAQTRWVFSSMAFGDLASISYNETPFNPGGFDVAAHDDGWYIDDITFTGLLEEQLDVIVDGGDDILAGNVIQCGPNLVAETIAERDDVQMVAVDAGCTSSSDVVVSAGGNGVIDSRGNDVCPTDPTEFCNTANARIQGRQDGVFATRYPGSPFVLDGTESDLDVCVGGTVQYEFVECDTTTLGGPCGPPASGSVLQGYSSDNRYTVYPADDSRYRLRVRCSSQANLVPPASCLGETEAQVRIYDAQDGGLIDMTVDCDTTVAGGATSCDPGDPLVFTFAKPAQMGNLSGSDLFGLLSADLASPVISSANCLSSGFGGAGATGSPVVLQEAAPFTPPAGTAGYYVVGHHQTVASGPSPAGLSRDESGVLVPRLVEPPCP